MSYDYLTVTNKQQKHAQTNFQKYLSNISEPYDDESHDLPFDREAELKENSYMMRRQLRRIAQRTRAYYS